MTNIHTTEVTLGCENWGEIPPGWIFALALLELLEATLVPYYFPGILCLIVIYFYGISVSEPRRRKKALNICDMVLYDVMHILLRQIKDYAEVWKIINGHLLAFDGPCQC